MPRTCAVLLITLLVADAAADTRATTEDGREVLLKEDGTWELLESAEATEETADPAEGKRVTLTVESRVPSPGSCLFGLRLYNGLEGAVRSIVPQVSAVLDDGTEYETVFAGFHGVKPTRTKYKEIVFSGIECRDIASLRVSGADRCRLIGQDIYTGEKGVCLGLIEVQEGAIIPISK